MRLWPRRIEGGLEVGPAGEEGLRVDLVDGLKQVGRQATAIDVLEAEHGRYRGTVRLQSGPVLEFQASVGAEMSGLPAEGLDWVSVDLFAGERALGGFAYDGDQWDVDLGLKNALLEEEHRLKSRPTLAPLGEATAPEGEHPTVEAGLER